MKNILSLLSFCVLLLGSVSLSAMDDDDDFCAALQVKFQEACNTKDVDALFELKDQLTSNGIIGGQSFTALIRSITDAQAVPADGIDSKARRHQIEKDRAIREEQDRTYQETLRVDRERGVQEQARLRAEQEQLRAELEAQKVQEEAWRQSEFNSMAILDECIAELCAGDPRARFNVIGSELGDHIGLLHLFNRQGFGVAQALKKANQKNYASEHDRQQEMCCVVTAALSECDEILAQCRAWRIVQNFLNPAEAVETVQAQGCSEETKEQSQEGDNVAVLQEQPQVGGVRERMTPVTTITPARDKNQEATHLTDSGGRQPERHVDAEGRSWGEWLRSPTGVAAIGVGAVVAFGVIKSLRDRR